MKSDMLDFIGSIGFQLTFFFLLFSAAKRKWLIYFAFSFCHFRSCYHASRCTEVQQTPGVSKAEPESLD